MFYKKNNLSLKSLFVLFVCVSISGLLLFSGCKVNKFSNTRRMPSIRYENSATGNVTLTWDEVPNAQSYNLYCSESSEVPKNDRIKILDVAKPPAKVPNLTRGKKYYFVVTAVNGGGESGYSNIVSYYVR